MIQAENNLEIEIDTYFRIFSFYNDKQRKQLYYFTL